MEVAISAVIKEAEGKKTAKQQAEILKKHKSAALKAVCGYAFDPAVRWLIPEGSPPPYKPLPKATDAEGALLRMYSQMEYLVDSEKGRRMTQIKREQIFIQLLESLDPDDAVLISKIRNKELKIDVEAVRMAFPSISQDW